jgi:protein-L-isoaspartate(D-aspartate) O-methyltransferase
VTGFLRSPELVEAFGAIWREWFVPGVDLGTVYDSDAAIPTVVVDGAVVSSSSAPGVMAVMLERLDLRAGHRVLEIGTGTGYNAALLAHVVGEAGSVTTVDIDEMIVERARRCLDDVGVHGVRCVAADGWVGVDCDAPFDRIIVTVGVADIAPSWTDQLDRSGVLVVPLWLRGGLQVVAALRHDGDDLVAAALEPCGFMRLRGPHAGRERYQPCGPWEVAIDDDMTDDQLRGLEQLLTGPCATVEVPHLVRGWFTALALTRSNAVQLTAYPRWAVGLFDPAGGCARAPER